MAQRNQEDIDSKIVQKIGIKYYVNFRLISIPDSESPTNRYLDSFVPVADVYDHGRWRAVVITGMIYKYREGEAKAERILDDAQKTQELFMKVLRMNNGMALCRQLTNPIDHFLPRYE